MKRKKTGLGLIAMLTIVYQLPLFSSNNSNRDSNNSNRQSPIYNSISEAIETSGISEAAPPDTVYIPPVGAKYTEIRSVDPAAPPAIIDIAGNLKNEKLFKLSDVGSSVRYVYLQEPPDTKLAWIREVLCDDKHIFISASQGLFCYSADGKYMHTLCVNQFEKMQNSRIMTGGLLMFNIDILDGNLIFRTYNWPPENEEPKYAHLNIFDTKDFDGKLFINNQSVELKNDYPKPNYKRQIRKTVTYRSIAFLNDQNIFDGSSLSYLTIQGDTICKFTDFDRPILPSGATTKTTTYQTVYRINGKLMMQKTYNDTVFRLELPNRFVPAYVMNWGEYKPDMNKHASGSAMEGMLDLGDWFETPRFVFIHYTEGRDYPLRRRDGKVNDHWVIYDKKTKTLTHHLASLISPLTGDRPIPPMLENDIEPIGMPFWPKGLTHKDEMYMIFSKEQLKAYIDTGKFDNKKLQPIYDNMQEGSFILMIVK